MYTLLEELCVGGGVELVLVALRPQHGEGVAVGVLGVHLGRHAGGKPGRGRACNVNRMFTGVSLFMFNFDM